MPQAKTLATSVAGGGDVPRLRAAPLNDPVGVAQRVSVVNHAQKTHQSRLTKVVGFEPTV
jgi:hypothetical protein